LALHGIIEDQWLIFVCAEDFAAAKAKALKIGAVACYIEDIREEFVRIHLEDIPAEVLERCENPFPFVAGGCLAAPGTLEATPILDQKLISLASTGQGAVLPCHPGQRHL